MNAAVHPSTMTATSVHSVASHAGILSVSQVIRRIFRMCIFLMSARMLGAEVFGSYVLLLTVVEMVAIVSGYGYMDYLTREIAQCRNSAWALARAMTTLRLAWILPSLGLGTLVLAVLHFSSALVINAAWLGATLFPRAITESAQGMLKGIRRFAPLPWIETAQGIIVLGVAPVLIFRGFGIRGIIAAEVLGAVAAAVVSCVSVVRSIRFRSSAAPALRSLLGTAFPFNVYPFLTNIYDRVDVVLLSRLAGNFATGIYSLPYRVFATSQIIPYSMMGALLPVLSADKALSDSAQQCARTMRVLFLTALLLVLGTLTFAEPAARFLLGRAYDGCIPTIQILIWAAIPAFLNFAMNTLLIAKGKEKVFLRTTAACTVFNIAANLLLIPRYSFLAAAAVTVATECLLFLLNSFYVARLAGHVVLPIDSLKASAVFASVLSVSRLLSHYIPAMWAGCFAVVLFLAFAVLNSGLGLHNLVSSMRERAT